MNSPRPNELPSPRRRAGRFWWRWRLGAVGGVRVHAVGAVETPSLADVVLREPTGAILASRPVGARPVDSACWSVKWCRYNYRPLARLLGRQATTR